MKKKKTYATTESIAEKQVFLILSKWLSQDLSQAFKTSTITQNTLKYYVDTLYKIQELRITISNRELAARKHGKPSSFVHALAKTTFILENGLKDALKQYLAVFRIAQWIAAHYSLGFVIAAGLLSELDIRKVKTCSSFWRFAGLDPASVSRNNATTPPPPYNRWLKSFVIGRLGDCFVKSSNNPNSFYGKLYAFWKNEILEKNERGEFKQAARQLLERTRKRIPEIEKLWQQGKLSESHCKRRARRLVVKVFLSHLFDQMYIDYYDKDPPAPYIFWKDKAHTHKIEPPFTIHNFTGTTLKHFYDD